MILSRFVALSVSLIQKASLLQYASILLVMAVSDPDAPNPYQRASMFIVPKDTPGVEIVRNGSRSSFS